jgi:hypothetical protein
MSPELPFLISMLQQCLNLASIIYVERLFPVSPPKNGLNRLNPARLKLLLALNSFRVCYGTSDAIQIHNLLIYIKGNLIDTHAVHTDCFFEHYLFA